MKYLVLLADSFYTFLTYLSQQLCVVNAINRISKFSSWGSIDYAKEENFRFMQSSCKPFFSRRREKNMIKK